MNFTFVQYGKWQPTKTAIKEEDEMFSFTHIAEALDTIHKYPIFAKPKPLNIC